MKYENKRRDVLYRYSKRCERLFNLINKDAPSIIVSNEIKMSLSVLAELANEYDDTSLKEMGIDIKKINDCIRK